MESITTFGSRLKHLRETAGLTQTQLANKLEVSRGAISYYENGERKPDIEFLEHVALFFDVSTDYLLGLSEGSTHDKEFIRKTTGLSDKAIGNLIYNNHMFEYFLQENGLNEKSEAEIEAEVKAKGLEYEYNFHKDEEGIFIVLINTLLERDILSLASTFKAVVDLTKEQSYYVEEYDDVIAADNAYYFAWYCNKHFSNFIDYLIDDIKDEIKDDLKKEFDAQKSSENNIGESDGNDTKTE